MLRRATRAHGVCVCGAPARREPDSGRRTGGRLRCCCVCEGCVHRQWRLHGASVGLHVLYCRGRGQSRAPSAVCHSAAATEVAYGMPVTTSEAATLFSLLSLLTAQHCWCNAWVRCRVPSLCRWGHCAVSPRPGAEGGVEPRVACGGGIFCTARAPAAMRTLRAESGRAKRGGKNCRWRVRGAIAAMRGPMAHVRMSVRHQGVFESEPRRANQALRNVLCT